AAADAYSKFNSKGANNVSSIVDPELDRLSEAALVEVDNKKRADLFGQMQRRIIDQVYYVSLPTIALYQATQPWLHNFSGSYSAQVSMFNTAKTWLEVE